MVSDLLLILGVAVLSVSLRTFRFRLLQKLGAAGIVATSFLIGWRVTGYWGVGLFCALSWLFLPWLEILTRVRKLRLPLERSLRQKSPPNSETFPALPDLTDEVEGEQFEHVQDTGWDWDDYQQYFRLFYHPAERTQAAICLIDQESVAFYYLSLSSRAKDGKMWTTWNYPFSYSLRLAPEWEVNRQPSDHTFLQLYESHREFLKTNGITLDQLEELGPEQIQAEIQKDLSAQIAHNLATGVLTKDDSGAVRYSWRGLFFIWFQFLRDLVRLS
jgi:hypothetical protein